MRSFASVLPKWIDNVLLTQRIISRKFAVICFYLQPISGQFEFFLGEDIGRKRSSLTESYCCPNLAVSNDNIYLAAVLLGGQLIRFVSYEIFRAGDSVWATVYGSLSV